MLQILLRKKCEYGKHSEGLHFFTIEFVTYVRRLRTAVYVI